MPTPRLTPGEWGKIRTYQLGKRRWKAVCQFCDDRGDVGQRSKTAGSEAAAIRDLKDTLTTQARAATGTAITGRSRLTEVAVEMFVEKRTALAAGRLSPGTLRNYKAHWRRYIQPALGNMAVDWMGVARCDQFLKTLRESKGHSTVAGVRAVLGEILAVAVRHEALPDNPIRHCADIPGDRHHRVKALDAAEAVRIWHLLADLATTPSETVNNRRYRPTLCDPMIPDLWLWMLGTGDRISQALAARWEWIDTDTGTARLGPNVIRVPGTGLRINEGTSKSQQVEGVDLPEQVIAMLLTRQQRLDYNPQGYVFPNADGGLLDPSNTSSKRLRPALKAIGYGNVSSHWCRRTLGSELNAAGLSLMDIAGRLRHTDSRTTERHYVDKRGGNPRVKAAIEAMLATAPEQRVVPLR